MISVVAWTMVAAACVFGATAVTMPAPATPAERRDLDRVLLICLAVVVIGGLVAMGERPPDIAP